MWYLIEYDGRMARCMNRRIGGLTGEWVRVCGGWMDGGIHSMWVTDMHTPINVNMMDLLFVRIILTFLFSTCRLYTMPYSYEI